MLLTLTIYTPTHYIQPSKMEKYAELYGDNRVNVGFTQANREQGIRRLTAINLMKRMESSVYSFNLTLTRIKDLINSTIETIDRFDKHSDTTLDLTDISDMDEFDAEDQNSDELFSFGRKVKIDLADMDYVSWRNSLAKDADVLELLTLLVGDITPEHDSKLQELFRVIDNKITHPINEGNKKLMRNAISSLGRTRRSPFFLPMPRSIRRCAPAVRKAWTLIPPKTSILKATIWKY